MGDAQANLALVTQDTPREIANANTFFKFSLLLLFVPLLPGLVWAVYKLVPISQEELSQAQNKPKFLDPVQLQTPSVAIEAVYKEIERLGTMTVLYYRHAQQAVLAGDLSALAKLEHDGKRLNQLHTEILTYVGGLTAQPMSEAENTKLVSLIAVLDVYENMLDVYENMLDVIKQGLLDAGYQMIDNKIKPSVTMNALFESLSQEIETTLAKGFAAAYTPNSHYYADIVEAKTKVDLLISQALEHQAKSLNNTEKRILIFRLEMQLADAFKRLHTLAKRAARISEREHEKKVDSAPINLVS